MKTTTKLTGLLLMILLAFSVTLNAQRGMRGNGAGYGMRQGMGIMPHQMAPIGKGFKNLDLKDLASRGSGRLIAESVPNVTEKQKQDIAELRLKQQEEMKKLREEASAKIQSLRDTHNKAILNILTDEQRKYIESKQLKPVAAPALTPAK